MTNKEQVLTFIQKCYSFKLVDTKCYVLFTHKAFLNEKQVYIF